MHPPFLFPPTFLRDGTKRKTANVITENDKMDKAHHVPYYPHSWMRGNTVPIDLIENYPKTKTYPAAYKGLLIWLHLKKKQDQIRWWGIEPKIPITQLNELLMHSNMENGFTQWNHWLLSLSSNDRVQICNSLRTTLISRKPLKCVKSLCKQTHTQ